MDVVAHQVKLMVAVTVSRMNGQLGRRQREDEPAAARVDRRQAQRVGEEGAPSPRRVRRRSCAPQ